MPRTRSLGWSELKIGLLTIVALVIASVLVFSLTGSRGFFWQRYVLKARFDNVAGLARGSPVRVAGVEVGTVSEVAFAGDQVEVVFEVNQDVHELITVQSTAYLGSVSLLGESAVDITPAPAAAPVPEWGYVPAGESRGQIGDVTERAAEGLEEITTLVQGLRRGEGTIGKLVTDDQLYAELRQFVASARDLTEGIRQGRGSLGRLMSDPTMAKALEGSLANVQEITRRLNAGEGSLGKLLRDDAFASTLTSATSNIDMLVARLNRGEGTLGRLMTDDAVAERLTSISERLDAFTARLNNEDGTVGRLLDDARLYENMNEAIADFRSLLAEIRKDPRRYLNVRVSIF